MADLKLTDDWATGIYQLEEADLVLGGPDGIDNRQAKELGARTNYLRKHGIAQWAAAIAYDVDCYVKHNGSLWRSKRVCLDKEPGKSADDWEVLTLPLSQLDARYHAKDGQLAWAKVTATPTTLAGYGITDSLKLDALDKRYHPYNGAYKWANLADKPTTLAGYGITDKPWAQPITTLSGALAAKADSARVDQGFVAVSAAVEKCLSRAEAKKTYLAIADVYDRSDRDDLVTAIAAGTANTLYSPAFTRPKGVYLVRPYRNDWTYVLAGGAYYMNAFAEFVSGTGGAGSINMTPDLGRSHGYDQSPFVMRITSASATVRFGLGVRGNGPNAGTVTITPGINGASFFVQRIG